MQLHQIQRALRELQALARSRTASTRDRLIHRVATRWLLAGQAQKYDILLRLQLLEGAADVPFGTWFKKGERGLGEAQEHFAKIPEAAVNPLWFSPQDTGAYMLTYSELEKLSRATRMEPLDVIHNALYGVPQDASKARTNLYKLHEVGKKIKQGILSGLESPKRAMSGMGGNTFKQLVLNEIRHFKKKRVDWGPREQGPSFEESIEGPTLDKDNAWDLLAAMWLDANDPLGMKLRNLMKKSWANWSSGPVMEQWLDESVKRRRILTSAQILETLGIIKPTWITNYYKPGMAAVAKSLKRDTSLFRALEERLMGMGFIKVDLDLDPSRVPSAEDINPKRLPGGTRPPPRVKILASDCIVPF